MISPTDRSALIAGYIDEELEEEHRDSVTRSIQEDPGWRAEYDAQLAVRERLAALPHARLPEGARARFGAALREHAQHGASSQAPEATVIPLHVAPPEPRTRWGAIGMAAAILLVSLAGWYLYDLSQQGPVAIAQEALAQYDVVSNDSVAWEAVASDTIAQELKSWGWTYHDLKDDDQELQLVGSWKGEVRSQRALAMAFERRGEVVLQLLVDKGAFNESEEVREAVRRAGVWSTVQGPRTLVGWNDGAHAVVMVGSGDPDGLSKYRPEACYQYPNKKKT